MSGKDNELPDRSVYQDTSATGYVRAVIRHASDEWVEFLEHDRRVIGISTATLVLGLVFSGLWFGWDFAMTDMLPGVLIALLPTIILAAAVYVWCFVKAPWKLHQRNVARARGLQDDVLEQIDVRLEGTYPGAFVLHADGHATEIRTGPVVLESTVYGHGTFRDGDRIMDEASPRYVIEFPVVSDLRDSDKEITPSLFYDDMRAPNGIRRSRHSDIPKAAPPMAEFFRMAVFLRTRERGKPDLEKISEAELETLVERRLQPHHFNFGITFWNKERTHQWTRHELLVYEPQSGAAFVRHHGKPQLTQALSQSQSDLAALHQANTRHENAVASLRTAIAELAPRTLSPQQQIIIKDGLRSIREWVMGEPQPEMPYIFIFTQAGVPDAEHYASQFDIVFNSCMHTQPNGTWWYRPSDVEGVLIVSPPDSNWPDRPPLSQIAYNALKRAGVDVALNHETPWGDNLCLVVGRKRGTTSA